MKTPTRVSPTADTNSSSLAKPVPTTGPSRRLTTAPAAVPDAAARAVRPTITGNDLRSTAPWRRPSSQGVGHGREHHRQRSRSSQSGDSEGEAEGEIPDHVDGHGEDKHQHRATRVAERVRGAHHHLPPSQGQQCRRVPQHRGRRPLGVGRSKAAMLEEQRDQRDSADEQETPHRHQHRRHRGQATADQPPHLIEVSPAGSRAERGIERGQQRRHEQGLAEAR